MPALAAENFVASYFKATFASCVKFVKVHDGGGVDHVHISGGRALRHYRKFILQPLTHAHFCFAHALSHVADHAHAHDAARGAHSQITRSTE